MERKSRKSYWTPAITLGAMVLLQAAQAKPSIETVVPSTVDASIAHFDDPNVVIANVEAGADAPLVVFMPGTGGRPENAVGLLQVIAAQGYRVIGLEYNDTPAVSQVCPSNPNPACASTFRELRIFGEGQVKVGSPPAESIVSRLTTLLAFLERTHPDDGWAAYRDASGKPVWNRIVLSGLSQGAGMAAYLAKLVEVKRVVLFSSPWDTTGRDKHPAPWLSLPSATPMDRWWAERHVDEVTTDLIANAYAALAIPSDQILLFDRPLARASNSDNPFHGSTIRDKGYVEEWKRMFGEGAR